MIENNRFKRIAAFFLIVALSICPVNVMADNNTVNYTFEASSDICRMRITTDDGNGGHYGPALTKGTGYARATIEFIDENGNNLITKPGNCSEYANEVKIRGNSTSGGIKKPYNIKFDKKENFFGFGESKKWTLLADYYDPTLMRNKYALELARDLGLDAAPKCRRIELWFDDVYQGVYLLTEKIEEEADLDTDNGDFMVEMDVPSGASEGDIYFNTTRGTCFRLREPEDQNAVEDVKAKLDEFESYIYTRNRKELHGMMDMDSFSSYYLLNEYLKTGDFWGKSVYFYYKNGKFYAGPAWDFDLSAGNYATSWGASDNLGNPEGAYASECQYFYHITRTADFRHAAYRKFLNKSSQIGDSENWITNEMGQYGSAFERNMQSPLWINTSWYQFIEAFKPLPTFTLNVNKLKGWFNRRYVWLSAYMTEDPDTGVFRDDDGELYYYENGVKSAKTGLILCNNEYFFIQDGSKAVTGDFYVVSTNNLMIPKGTEVFPERLYHFDENGSMFVPLEYENVTHVLYAPTCTEDGAKEHWYVERTGRRYTDETGSREITWEDVRIPALGHDFKVEVIAPTVEAGGYTHYDCRRCGYKYDDSFINDIMKTESKKAGRHLMTMSYNELPAYTGRKLLAADFIKKVTIDGKTVPVDKVIIKTSGKKNVGSSISVKIKKIKDVSDEINAAFKDMEIGTVTIRPIEASEVIKDKNSYYVAEGRIFMDMKNTKIRKLSVLGTKNGVYAPLKGTKKIKLDKKKYRVDRAKKIITFDGSIVRGSVAYSYSATDPAKKGKSS